MLIPATRCALNREAIRGEGEIVVVKPPRRLVAGTELRALAVTAAEGQLWAGLPVIIKRLLKELARGWRFQFEPNASRQIETHPRARGKRVAPHGDGFAIGF